MKGCTAQNWVAVCLVMRLFPPETEQYESAEQGTDCGSRLGDGVIDGVSGDSEPVTVVEIFVIEACRQVAVGNSHCILRRDDRRTSCRDGG